MVPRRESSAVRSLCFRSNRASTLSMPMPPVRIGSPHSRPTLEYQPPVHDGPPTGKFCGSKLLIPEPVEFALGDFTGRLQSPRVVPRLAHDWFLGQLDAGWEVLCVFLL